MSEAGSYDPGELSADGRWRWDGTEWRPASSQAIATFPRWLHIRLRRQATWLTVASALLAGVLTDQALRSGTFGIAAALTVVLGGLLIVVAGGVTRAEPRMWAALAATFGLWLAIRASPWLLWPDLVAGVALLGFSASVSAKGSIFDLGTAELGARIMNATAQLSAGASFIARPIAASRSRLAGAGPIVRGLAIAAPICIVLSLLLASADPVFASFFSVNLDVGQLLTDLFFVVLGSLAMAGLLRLAAGEPVERTDGPEWRLGATEALIVLALLDAVFAAFAAAQVLAATGAAADTLRSAGMSYSDYARSGFFQLLWVGGLTLVLLIVFSRITGLSKPEHRLAFLVLAEIAIALTLMIVVVAFRRLSLYEDAYGFTMLRLYSHIFAGWLAVVFVLLAAELLRRWRRRWFVGAVAISALTALLALNFVNPEALVVGLNVSHYQSTGKIDVQYLGQLSSDAMPAIFASLPTGGTALDQKLAAAGCRGPRSYSGGIGAYNWSDAEAAADRRASCH